MLCRLKFFWSKGGILFGCFIQKLVGISNKKNYSWVSATIRYSLKKHILQVFGILISIILKNTEKMKKISVLA